MVSSPSFDPNMFISGSDSDQKIRSVLSDKETPLVNRAIQNQYPPGSIFKIVTTTAGLETRKISETATVF
jgi:penicillin-binding protein 2